MATIAGAARWSFPSRLQLIAHRRLPFSASFSSAAPPAAMVGFGWADALRVAGDGGRGDESDLTGYFRKVDICNRGMDKKGQFVEFLVEDQVVGYIHKGFVEHLRDFHDVFTIVSGNSGNNSVEHVRLHSLLITPEDRTHAVGSVIKSLGEIIPALPSSIILWHACVFLSGTCCCSLLWYKGLWSSYEWVCREGWSEISLDWQEK